MSWRTTAVLLVILLALGGFVIYQNRQAGDAPESTPAATPAPTVETIDPVPGALDDVRRLAIFRHADNTETEFTRSAEGDWFTTTLTATQVVSQTLNSAMSSLTAARLRRTLATDANPLSAYGLDAPSHTIIVTLKQETNADPISVTLTIGNETPAGDAYYLLIGEDSRVHLMSTVTLNNVLDLLDDPPEPAVTPTPAPTPTSTSFRENNDSSMGEASSLPLANATLFVRPYQIKLI